MLLAIALMGVGCGQMRGTKTATTTEVDGDILIPGFNATYRLDRDTSGSSEKITRFAANSPFDVKYKSPLAKAPKRLWASSYLWEKGPEFVAEKWLTEEPDTEGKYVLIEFWASWCYQCRRSIPLLNRLHKKYSQKLIVIGISDETQQQVEKLKEPKMDFYSAIDTKARMKEKLGIFSVPHVIILEPGGYVVWEGFPLLKGYELTDQVIESILDVGRKLKTGGRIGQ